MITDLASKQLVRFLSCVVQTRPATKAGGMLDVWGSQSFFSWLVSGFSRCETM